jgi:hypothetical protein
MSIDASDFNFFFDWLLLDLLVYAAENLSNWLLSAELRLGRINNLLSASTI